MSEFEDTLPPPNEPCFYIALPESLHDLVPVNATKLLREWEYGLDPIEALRVALAKTLGSQRYSIRDRFVVPSFGALTLV